MITTGLVSGHEFGFSNFGTNACNMGMRYTPTMDYGYGNTLGCYPNQGYGYTNGYYCDTYGRQNTYMTPAEQLDEYIKMQKLMRQFNKDEVMEDLSDKKEIRHAVESSHLEYQVKDNEITQLCMNLKNALQKNKKDVVPQEYDKLVAAISKRTRNMYGQTISGAQAKALTNTTFTQLTGSTFESLIDANCSGAFVNGMNKGFTFGTLADKNNAEDLKTHITGMPKTKRDEGNEVLGIILGSIGTVAAIGLAIFGLKKGINNKNLSGKFGKELTETGQEILLKKKDIKGMSKYINNIIKEDTNNINSLNKALRKTRDQKEKIRINSIIEKVNSRLTKNNEIVTKFNEKLTSVDIKNITEDQKNQLVNIIKELDEYNNKISDINFKKILRKYNSGEKLEPQQSNIIRSVSTIRNKLFKDIDNIKL